MPLPNNLREFRKAQGLTQEQVAHALGLDGNAVSRHERGVINPKAPTRNRYAEFYGVAECLLWPDDAELPNVDEAVLSAPWTPRGTVKAATALSRRLDGGGGTVQRRSFLVLAGVAVTAPAHRWLVDEPEPLVAALNGDRVTPELAARLPPMIAELRRMDDAQGGPMVLSLAEREFAWVAELLDNGTYDEPTGRALYRALAELGQLAAWLANDVGPLRSRNDTESPRYVRRVPQATAPSARTHSAQWPTKPPTPANQAKRCPCSTLFSPEPATFPAASLPGHMPALDTHMRYSATGATARRRMGPPSKPSAEKTRTTDRHTCTGSPTATSTRPAGKHSCRSSRSFRAPAAKRQRGRHAIHPRQRHSPDMAVACPPRPRRSRRSLPDRPTRTERARHSRLATSRGLHPHTLRTDAALHRQCRGA